MPLKRGSSRETISANTREHGEGVTFEPSARMRRMKKYCMG